MWLDFLAAWGASLSFRASAASEESRRALFSLSFDAFALRRPRPNGHSEIPLRGLKAAHRNDNQSNGHIRSARGRKLFSVRRTGLYNKGLAGESVPRSCGRVSGGAAKKKGKP